PELLDCARAFLRVARVCGPPRDAQTEAAEPFSRCLQVAPGIRRLADERRRRTLRCACEHVTRSRAPDLLVGGEHDAQRALGLRAADRLEQHDEAALHVVAAGPERPSVL